MRHLLNFYHYLLAFLASSLYRNPSREIFVGGVTGTKGKSTVIEIMSAIMERAGLETAILSTVRRKVGESDVLNDGNTMPGRFAIQKFLRDAVWAGAKYAFIEVTSQGVIQHRHRFIDWDAAFFTNLEPEHIEAHGGFEKYKRAKLDFFLYLSRSRKARRYFFALENKKEAKDFLEAARKVRAAEIYEARMENAEDFFSGNPFFAPEFNQENAALAIAFARSQGISDKVISDALRNFSGVPGRLEYVQREPFSVVVDYAHTPESLKKILGFLKKNQENENGKLFCVFGSMGGDRDKWKRPEMGRAAAKFCDYIILTDEDPCDDDPKRIVDEIEIGILQTTHDKWQIGKSYWKIIDRGEAIKKAVSLARPGDIAAITGKGSQQSMTVRAGKKIPWSDAETARNALKK